MRAPFYIAFRYLRAKKSQNVVSMISSISITGVALSTMAIICALSVFNGFQDLISTLYSQVDPDLKISCNSAKVFEPNGPKWEKVKALPNVAFFCEVIEDNVMVQYKNRQISAILKGVSECYPAMIEADSIVLNGAFELNDPIVSYANMGVALAGALGTNAHFIDPITLYAPSRQSTINMANPMASIHSESLFMASIVSINQLEFDSRYIIAPIAVAKKLFDYPTQVSQIEIKARKGSSINKLQQQISQILGSDYQISNQKEQQADFLKVTNIEKWVTFLILIFILLIATFNVISTLSMLIVDKREDIQTLYALGADQRFIRRLFLLEGWMISLLGTIIGIIAGTLLCLAQQYFGLLTLGSDASFIVDSYPVRVDPIDIMITLITVAIIGFIATLYPVYSIRSQSLHKGQIGQNSTCVIKK